MFHQKITTGCEDNFAKIYDPPDIRIQLLDEADIITQSEIGGQWPWGEAQTIDFGA